MTRFEMGDVARLADIDARAPLEDHFTAVA